LHDLPQGTRRGVRLDRPGGAVTFSLAGWSGDAWRLSIIAGPLPPLCSRCGSHILAERPEDPHVVLRVATLDDDPGVRPVVRIFIADSGPWLDEGDDLPRYLTWPPGR
jgi:hypothetical protein